MVNRWPQSAATPADTIIQDHRMDSPIERVHALIATHLKMSVHALDAFWKHSISSHFIAFKREQRATIAIASTFIWALLLSIIYYLWSSSILSSLSTFPLFVIIDKLVYCSSHHEHSFHSTKKGLHRSYLPKWFSTFMRAIHIHSRCHIAHG